MDSDKILSYEKLNEIALKHGTDKASNGHDYMRHYAKHLPESCGKMMEIGAYKGASLRMWRDVYPDAEIHTIDLFGEFEGKYKGILEKEGFVCHQGNQTHVKFLNTITDQFDLIIEDGSHNSKDQLISFSHHFAHNLKSGGLWVTEDLHACRIDFYRPHMSFSETLLYWIQAYLANETATDKYIDPVIYGMIDKVYLYDEKIAFITKC